MRSESLRGTWSVGDSGMWRFGGVDDGVNAPYIHDVRDWPEIDTRLRSARKPLSCQGDSIVPDRSALSNDPIGRVTRRDTCRRQALANR